MTGSNGGLGSEFVSRALARGAAKVYASARTPRTWDDSRVVPLELDVADGASVARAAAASGDVTVVVNNAGVLGPMSLLESELSEVRAAYETNVFGPIAVAKAYAPTLRAAGGGALIDVLSVMSWVPGPGAYYSSKSAFWSVTNSLRLEFAEQGTQVVGAYLSFVDTPFTAALEVPKADPVSIVDAIYDGLESGATEVFADQPSRDVRALLSGPVEKYSDGLFRNAG